MAAAIFGNFLAAALARFMGYRRSIALLCLAYALAMVATYVVPRNHTTLLILLPIMGACGGLFALFTMYLPPLFPVLLRTTGAGFCYNIGRIAAAIGTVVFGLFSKVGDYRFALFLRRTPVPPGDAPCTVAPRSPRTRHRDGPGGCWGRSAPGLNILCRSY